MARPTYVSPAAADTDISVAHVGAGLLGQPLLRQGEEIARVMEARRARHADRVRYPDVVVEMGRRGGKTTSIWSVILGRAATRESYRAVVTAQTGNIASRILVEMGNRMVRNGTAALSKEGRDDLPALYLSNGKEHIVWPNGNVVWAVPPDAGSVRSAEADDILVDESGELDVVKGADFLDAVRPLQDTKGPLAQFIMAGTPSTKGRSGPFWATLEKARNKAEPDQGIVDWCVKDNETFLVYPDGEDAPPVLDRKVVRRVHPGPDSGLTPYSVLEKRFKDLGAVVFGREYMSLWAPDHTVRAIDADEWRAREVVGVAPPPWCGVGFDCERNGTAGSIALAWRVEGAPVVALTDYRPGTAWVANAVRGIRERHPRVPVANDPWGPSMPTVEDLERGAGRRRVDVLRPGFRGMAGATQTFVRRLPDHLAQPDLERAVEGATWREVEVGRLFDRRRSTDDISPLVACVLALWAYDNRPQRPRIGVVSSSDTRAE